MNTKIRSFAFCLTACLLACSQSWAQRGPQDNWYLEKTVSLPTLQGFDSPMGISFSNNGDVYVAGGASHKVSVWDSNGHFKNSWGGSGSGDGQFSEIKALFVFQNEVFVNDYNNHRVQVFDLNGSFKRKFGSYGTGDGQLRKPFSICVNANGINGPEVYVGDYDNSRITVFDLNGTYLRKFGHYTNSNSGFNRPKGISLGNDGKLYISSFGSNDIRVWDKNGTYLRKFSIGKKAHANTISGSKIAVATADNHCVRIYDTNGTFIRQIGSGTSSANIGNFNFPHGIEVDANGDLHVSCMINDRIQVFDINGTYKRTYGYYGSKTLNHSGALATAEGTLIMSCNANHQVVEIDENASVLRILAVKGAEDGRVNNPYYLSLDSQNRIYIADRLNHRIQVLDRNGTFIRKFGTFGTGDGQFNQPIGTAISQQNELFVTDSENHRVQVFDLNGTFIRKWGSQGTLDGQLKKPHGIAVDDAGQVYVAEYGGNNRVSVFSTTGQFLYKFATSGSRNDIVWVSLTPTGLLLTGGETTSSYQNQVRLREKNGNLIKDWNLGDNQYDGRASLSLQLANGTIVAFDRDPQGMRFYKQTYRSLVFEPSKKAPLCEVISVIQQAGTNNLDIKFRITDADSSKVKAGLLAFVDGGNDLSKVIVPKTFVGSVAGKLDENTTTGVTHTVTWNAQADWNVTYGNIELAVVAQDDRDLMNLHFLTLPGTDSNSTELKINRSPLSNTDLLNAWYTLLALGDSGIEINDGSITEPIVFPDNIISPDSLDSLQMWLDATDINGNTLTDSLNNNTPIEKWVDKSNAEYNATQQTESRKPILKSGQLNGKPTVFFDNTNDSLVTSLDLIAPYTVGIIYNNLDTYDRNSRAIQGSTNWLVGPYGRKNGLYANGWVYRSGIIDKGRYYTAFAVNDNSRSWFYVDGIDRTTSPSPRTSPRTIFIGAKDGYEPLNGHVAEVMIFNTALSTTEIDNLNIYLLHKWGVGGENLKNTYAHGSTTYAAGREYLFNKMNLREATSAEITRAKEAATPGVTNKFTPTFKVGPGERPEKVNEYNFETQQTGYWVVPKN